MRDLKEVTVLVVDDEVPLRKAMVFDLERRGFKVLSAGNGRAAYELVEKHDIDLILSDVRMPDGDGIELLFRTKERNSERPSVILVTGFADLEPEEAYHLGAAAMFTKPFDRKELMAAVMKAVSGQEEYWREKRAERPAVEFEVELRSKDLNLGRGGFFLDLKDRFPQQGAGAKFRIRFDEGPIDRLEGTGIVRWVRTVPSDGRRAGCGIEFEHLDDGCRSRIVELIQQMKAKPFIPRV